MKLNYINEIADTCCEFMTQVIGEDDCLDYEVLMKRAEDICNEITEHYDDTIDIDYKNMCFTVHLDRVLGQWRLCENATYYVWKNECGLPEVKDTIDIELF